MPGHFDRLGKFSFSWENSARAFLSGLTNL